MGSTMWNSIDEGIDGGFGETNPINNTVAGFAVSVRAQIEHQAGTTFALFKPHSYRSQVVAGMNYSIKIEVENDEYIHVQLHQSLREEISLGRIERGKRLHDPL
jgi:cystatin-A/B